jgi:hypothetical protein
MLKTIIALGVLIAATFLAPLWIQIALYAICILFIPYRLFFLIPAIIADAYYAPTASFSYHNLTTTIVVGAMLIVQWLVVRKTRVKHIYGLEKTS